MSKPEKGPWRRYWDAFVDAGGRCVYCLNDLDVARPRGPRRRAGGLT